MKKILFVLAFLFPILSFAVEAGPVASVIIQFGLLGHWAVDCSLPPSASNPYGTYEVSDGVSTLTYEFGPQYYNRVWTFTMATISENDSIILVASLPDGTISNMTLRKANGKIQNYQAVESTGVVRIKDGIYTINGKEAAWLKRCN